LCVPKRVKVSTAHPSPSRSSRDGTPRRVSIWSDPSVWSANSMSVRSASGVSAGL